MPQIQTARFGPLNVDETDVLFFPEGLLGFENRHRFVLLEEERYRPFIWMQSLDDPELCFVLTDPLLFFPHYEVPVRQEDIEPIRLRDLAAARVLVILVLPKDPREATANLQGPLVINVAERLARQLVLLDDRYTTRHRLLEAAPASQRSASEAS